MKAVVKPSDIYRSESKIVNFLLCTGREIIDFRVVRAGDKYLVAPDGDSVLSLDPSIQHGFVRLIVSEPYQRPLKGWWE